MLAHGRLLPSVKGWSQAGQESGTPKERMLRESLELVVGERRNEDAVADIVRAAVDAHLLATSRQVVYEAERVILA
jgi:hypothetical protein